MSLFDKPPPNIHINNKVESEAMKRRTLENKFYDASNYKMPSNPDAKGFEMLLEASMG